MTRQQHEQVTAVSFLGMLIIGVVPGVVANMQGLTLPWWFVVSYWVWAYYMSGIAARSLARQFRKEEQQ